MQVWTQNAAFIWVPWIAIASLAAWFGMHDIADAKASLRRAGRHLPAQAQLADVRAVPGHLRLVHRLAAGFPLLIKASSRRQPAGLRLARPAGGRGDPALWRLAGRQARRRRVTFWNFIVMAWPCWACCISCPRVRRLRAAVRPAEERFTGFFVMFLMLFPPPASATVRPSA
jgi:NNP family nitrate/nitrite transporter-like MFS transporter